MEQRQGLLPLAVSPNLRGLSAAKDIILLPGWKSGVTGENKATKEFQRQEVRNWTLPLRLPLKMDNLPVELRRAILTHLPLPTLRSLRLTSRTWASFGSEYLISPLFTTLPHRDDLPRLLSIASHPVFAPRIQSLQLNAGEVNEYHARHNTYFIQYMRDADERALALEGAWGRYAAVKAEKERHLAAFFQEEGLAEALGKLTNLRALEVSLTRCPFDIPDTPDLDLFREVWKIPVSGWSLFYAPLSLSYPRSRGLLIYSRIQIKPNKTK